MIKMVERKVRSRAKQLYESRGQTEGQDLQDWFQAETEVLKNTMVASLYRRLRNSSATAERDELSAETGRDQSAMAETAS